MSDDPKEPTIAFDDLNDSTYYKASGRRGVKLCLPEGYQATDQPDWRVGLFSIVIPTMPLRDDFAFPEPWISGRFKGVSTIEVIDDVSLEIKKPTVFHQSAKTWFRPPLRSSMGDKGVDAAKPSKYAKPEDKQVSALAKRIVFDADLNCEDGLAIPLGSPAKYKIKVNSSEPMQGNDYATVSLLCGEFVQYNGPHVHPVEKAHIDVGTQEKKDAFVILHVAVENCSNMTLKMVTDSLNREGARVRVEPWESERVWSELEKDIIGEIYKNKIDEDGRGAEISLLSFFFGRVMRSLMPDHSARKGAIDKDFLVKRNEDREYPVTLKNAGFINLPQGVKFPSITRPFVVSLIIPGKDTVYYPPYLLSQEECANSRWHPAEVWGWYLSNRYNQYNTVIPDLRVPCSPEFKVDDFADWTMLTAEQGISIVRKGPIHDRNNVLWGLVQTRFVDIALLVRRSATYMSALQHSLRNLRGGLLEILEAQSTQTIGEMDEDSAESANEAVARSILKFQKIQNDFMLFRDHLWFEYVSGRPLESKLLQHFTQTAGCRNQYDDLSSEIELRQRVYESLSQSIRIQVDSTLEEGERRRAEQEEWYSTLLGVVAAALAVPGFISLYTEEQGWNVLLIALVVTVIFGVLIWKIQPDGKQSTSNKSREKSHNAR